MNEPRNKLYEPFPWSDVEYRVTATYPKDKPEKGLLAYYITARCVMNRLDDYCAETGGSWWDSYAPVDATHVECQLTVEQPDKDGNLRPITRSDVGEPSAGLGDPLKGAYSSALKRAAVKFGIGRDLYEIDDLWVQVDERKRVTAKGQFDAKEHYAAQLARLREDVSASPSAPDRAGGPQQARDDGDDGIAPAAGTGRKSAPSTKAGARDLSAFWAEVRGELKFTPEEAATEAGADIISLSADQLTALLQKLRAKRTAEPARA